MDLKMIHTGVVFVVLIVVSGGRAHLLPQALEDVHTFVQSELQQRSQGELRALGVDTRPEGGQQFQATTTTYIGVPVMVEKEVNLNGGIQQPSEDLSIGQSQVVQRSVETTLRGADLARGLIPPSPLPDSQTQASNEQPQIIPANLLGPSTFVSNAPQDGSDNKGTKMEGWVPLDNSGAQLAQGVGVKLQVSEGNGEDPAYKNTGYSPRPENEVDGSTLHINDLVIGTKDKKGKFPVYPGNSDKSAKVVIHAQNVIIRDGRGGGDVETASALLTNGSSNIKQYSAYSMVPQLNNYLRDQLRMAAVNQLLQSHPLNGKKLPRPLSLREIAQAARNGQFPDYTDPLLQQASIGVPQHLSFSIPHMVKMSGDSLPLSSIQQPSKLSLAGNPGLGALYRNMFQESQGAFDPREPLDYSLLAALSGSNVKIPQVPSFKSKPGGAFSSDYGDSVGYSAPSLDDDKPFGKDPIKIVSAIPGVDEQLRKPGGPTGSLRQISDDLLKQMIIQELEGRPPKSPYGSNAHPFAFLGSPDSSVQGSIDDYSYADGGFSPYSTLKTKPSLSIGQPIVGYGSYEGSPDGIMPVNKDTIMQLGKGLLYQAMEFSKKHNPMTFLEKIRGMPPVKLEFYKKPMGIPDDIYDKLPKTFSTGIGNNDPEPLPYPQPQARPEYIEPPPKSPQYSAPPPPPQYSGPPPQSQQYSGPPVQNHPVHDEPYYPPGPPHGGPPSGRPRGRPYRGRRPLLRGLQRGRGKRKHFPRKYKH